MSSITTQREWFIRAGALVLIISMLGGRHSAAQQVKGRTRVLVGSYDSELPYPVQEGKMGQRDPAAMAEIQLAVASSRVPENGGLELTGTLTNGSGSAQEHYSTYVAIESGRRFRLDVRKPDGSRTLRIDGDSGRTQLDNEPVRILEDSAFVHPLSLPSLLSEITDLKQAAVVDDGSVMIGDHPMNKVTITLFSSHGGSSVSGSFYFEGGTGELRKSVFFGHSLGNRSLVYLDVVTYGGYRKDGSLVLPHEYSETANGQLIMKFNVTNVSVTAGHDRSYFEF